MSRRAGTWGPVQGVLRSLVVAGPLGALLLAVSAGAGVPPGWVVAVVAGAAVAWAVRPEGAGGVVCLVAVLGWWAWSVTELSPWALPTAGLLVLAHCAALVAALGPGDLVPGVQLLRSWGRRVLLLAVCAVPVWGIGELLVAADQGPPRWVWPLAAVLTAGVGILVMARVLEGGRPR